MEMERISYSLRELLVAQGIEAGRAGTRKRHGIGAGLPGGTPTDPLADAAAGGPRIRSGMEKTGSAKPPESRQEDFGEDANIRQARRHPFLVVSADNVDVMPTRKNRAQTRPFLMCIEGGKP
jgi:hypothetical protein